MNIQDGSKAKFRVAAKVVPKCKLWKVYGFITTLQLQGNTEQNTLDYISLVFHKSVSQINENAQLSALQTTKQ